MSKSRTQIWKRLKDELQILVRPEKPGPSYPVLPDIDASSGETSRRDGLFIAGEAAGEPLLKVALNRGYEWIEHVAPEVESLRDKSQLDYDVIIIGAGATGFAAANRAHERGLSYLLLESGRFCNLVESFTKGKVLFNEPHVLEQKGSIWFEECEKEELLERWKAHANEIDLNLHEFEKVEDIKGSKGQFEVITTKSRYKAALVLVAIGKSGNPRKAGVPGESEHEQRIHHFLSDPDQFNGQNICVYGGGDVAVEAAMALCDNNSVTLATIDERFIFPKKRNADAASQAAVEGKLTVHFDTRLQEVREKNLVLANQSTGAKTEVPYDVLFEMIGSVPPVGFFKKIGVGIANTWNGSPVLAFLSLLTAFGGLSLWAWGVGTEGGSALILPGVGGLVAGIILLVSLGRRGNRYAWLGLTMLIAYTLYAAKASSPHFPFHWIGPERIAEFLSGGVFGWFVPKAVIALKGAPSFWYSLLYTVLVVIFGIRAMRRWGTNFSDKYQRNRYISIIAFQVVFFIVVNLVLSVVIGKYYWRGWGLYQPFPLFYNTFFWWYPGDPATIKWFFIGFGLLLTFIVIPIVVRYHGMRFCTWVCGCGGLAETFGDEWRHLAPKGLKSRKWEFMGPVVLVWAFVSLAIIVFAFKSAGSNSVWGTYDYIVDFWLVAVIPIGLYPFFGGKIWCRYWCPLAHYMKFLSSWYGKLRIVSNDKCISCTQCSKYCQVGVDVMEFAKNQEPFDNKNSSCIHCGICITVCPVNVLSFDSSADAKRSAELVEPGFDISSGKITTLF